MRVNQTIASSECTMSFVIAFIVFHRFKLSFFFLLSLFLCVMFIAVYHYYSLLYAYTICDINISDGYMCELFVASPDWWLIFLEFSNFIGISCCTSTPSCEHVAHRLLFNVFSLLFHVFISLKILIIIPSIFHLTLTIDQRISNSRVLTFKFKRISSYDFFQSFILFGFAVIARAYLAIIKQQKNKLHKHTFPFSLL